MISLGFTGSRLGMTDEQKITTENLLLELNPDHVHHGDCVGADETFHEIATQYKFIRHVHPPSDPKFRAFCEGDVVYEERSYLRRNKDIVRLTDELIATPSSISVKSRGSGTWTTIGYAREKGMPIHIVYEDGKVIREN